MSIHGFLGGVISATAPSVTTAGASGIFTLEEQLQASAQNNWPGYQISRSVRLRSSASAYFSRTVGAGNQQKWTWSGWVKFGSFTSGAGVRGVSELFGTLRTSNYTMIGLNPADSGASYQFGIESVVGTAGGSCRLYTTAVLRDPSAWYHLVLAVDTTQATAANRILIYVNGVSQAITTIYTPAPSLSMYINENGVSHGLGAAYTSSYGNFDGEMTEVNFIDGQQLAPTSFGAFDAVTGVWNPIRYTGTYGNNGFYLNFKDPTSTTTIGYDYSGNSNNWTSTQVSVTPGTTYDSMVDVPIGYGSDTGVGGELRGNYAVMNPLDQNASLPAPTNGNLNLSNAASAWFGIRSTMAVTSGKWYAEVTQTGSNSMAGVMSAASALTFASYTGATGIYGFFNNGAGTAGYPYSNGSSGTTFTIASGDVIGLAYDFDAQTLAIYRNGALQATVTSIPKTTPMFFCAFFAQTTATQAWNFGQRAFANTAPSGYKALCTQNLPAPTINNGANYMAATLYTGTGGTQVISNSVNSVSFQPDLVWVKDRSSAQVGKLTDSPRGVTKGLVPSTTASETTDANGVTAFNSNGFSLGTGDRSYNDSNADSYVAWQWRANGATGVTNTDGTITSTVSALPEAGFSIVKYTGTGTTGTVGHGLGTEPQLIINKIRLTSAGENWPVYTKTTGATNYMALGSQNGSGAATIWNNTAPTTSSPYVFSVLGGNWANITSNTYITYCWASINGYSSISSYLGNASTDGPFVYCGFRPRFLMIKSTSGSTSWVMIDTARNTYNVSTTALYADVNYTETTIGTVNQIDILSNGFKLRNTTGYVNASQTYTYAAFAENPFNISRAR